MDYREAIEIHIEECKHRIDVISEFMRSNGDSDKNKCNKNIDVLKIAISAMQELQEYHKTGLTPEQIREIDKLYSEKCRELAEERKNRG